ncbi:glucose-1-phosphate thymidylyltransferase RfbA [Hellea sp.]|nr:glucose-1-phosphate thymidylyltransferase RfbA [Hellea sp.]
MKKRKGIILAGGSGTRLHPSTIAVSKQLMPVFDKPMIYYPISVLMSAGINEILIITTPHDMSSFKKLLGTGSQFGVKFTFAIQPRPDGLAQALIIAEEFLDGGPSILILGDNLFFGQQVKEKIEEATKRYSGATVFGYKVKKPGDYGVVCFDKNNNVVSIVEKPAQPESNYAVTGLYVYDGNASAFAKEVKPSARGEVEITELNNIYLKRGELTVELFSTQTTWLDTGTHRSLLKAAQYVSVIEERQGIRVCCPEVIAFEQGWIDKKELLKIAKPLEKSGYGSYLAKYASQDHLS